MRQRATCHLPDKGDLFIELRDVVTVVTYEQWWASKGNESYDMVPQIVASWSLTDPEGKPLPQPSDLVAAESELPAALDIAVAAWLLQSISRLLNERVMIPKPNASESPAKPSA